MNRFFFGIGMLTLVLLPLEAGASTREATLMTQIEALQQELNALIASRITVTTMTPNVNVVVRSAGADTLWRYRYAKQKQNIGSEVKRRAARDTENATTTYAVTNGALKGAPTAIDRAIFGLVAKIMGSFVSTDVTEFRTYRDPESKTLAAVELYEKSPGWAIRVNATGASVTNEKWMRDMAAVLIHEFGHIVTLEDDQVDHAERRGAACQTFMSEAGCSKKGSYSAAFADTFWSMKDLARAKADAPAEYRRNKNAYITSYAARSVEEDMAETFAEFILNGKPGGTAKIKDQKVLFFYQYPELVLMRERIRAEVEVYFKK